mmetsp:Transcript_1147/g.1510  ORF Transcript_1147/g.1510 Transcript_1147/m.1510 type:complete len:86 (-) Transcript_1147:112-369(-)
MATMTNPKRVAVDADYTDVAVVLLVDVQIVVHRGQQESSTMMPGNTMRPSIDDVDKIFSLFSFNFYQNKTLALYWNTERILDLLD